MRELDARQVSLQGWKIFEASAGTGKTYTITSIVLRLLLEEEVPIGSILTVTFTNAATQELADRIRVRVEQALQAVLRGTTSEDPVLAQAMKRCSPRRARQLLGRALGAMDQAAVLTIHGFCVRVLSEHSVLSGRSRRFELRPDLRKLHHDALADFWSLKVARMDDRELSALGANALFPDLRRVAREAEVDRLAVLVDVEACPPLQEVLTPLEAAFLKAREAFAQGKDELVSLLTSRLVKQNLIVPKTVISEAEKWSAIFASGDPMAEPPGESEKRWTRTGVGERVSKGSRLEHPLLDAFEELFRARVALESWSNRKLAELRHQLVNFVRARAQELKSQQGVLGFDDLLIETSDALRSEPYGRQLAEVLRERYPYVLIDEFQDTDGVQCGIFETIYRTVRKDRGPDPKGAERDVRAARQVGVFLIGDPKQSIYSFRGADVFSYLAARGAEGAELYSLSRSYRSSPGLVKAQNALLSLHPFPFVEGSISAAEVQSALAKDVLVEPSGQPACALTFLELEGDKDPQLFRKTAEEIAHMLGRGLRLASQGKEEPLNPGHFAVLCRTNKQCESVQRELARLGIPAVMHGDRSVLEAPEALELRRILLALLTPTSRRLVRSALITRLIGVDLPQILALEHDVDEASKWATRFAAWASLLRGQGVVAALEAMAQETNLLTRTLGEPDGERRMTNFRHLMEILHEVESRDHLGPLGVLGFLEAAIEDPSGHPMAPEARQIRLESDAEAVTLTTLHKSKGLEYDLVFLPTVARLDEERPSPAFRFRAEGVKEQGRFFLEVRESPERDEARERAWAAQCAEDTRLAYVGITRARHAVYVLLPFKAKSKRASSSESTVRRFSALKYWLYGSLGPPLTTPLWAQFIQGQDAEQRERVHTNLIQASQGAVEFRPVQEHPPERYERPRDATSLVRRPGPAVIPRGTWQGSFSSLTSRRGADEKPYERRRDETGDWADQVETGAYPRAVGRPCVLRDFPRGPSAGDALHGVLEKMPFRLDEGALRRTVIEQEFIRRGIASEHCESVARAMDCVLTTPLCGGLFSLADLGPSERRAEMEFHLPIHERDGGGNLSARGLVQALRTSGKEEPPSALSSAYLAALEGLPFSAWAGFLRGFIDLVVEHQGRLYVIDYKSNFLGETFEDYTTISMAGSMEQHHYYLQAYLYALAVHRHAKTRRKDYQFDRHFGGVLYLFLRGMPGAGEPDRGTFFLRPSEAEMTRLSDFFGGTSRRLEIKTRNGGSEGRV